MTKVFRPYQTGGVAFLDTHTHGGLFIDMGLGKTAIMLHGLPKGRTLLVGPIRVIETVWHAEAADWPATQGLTFSLVRGSPRARMAALQKNADVYMTNPEVLADALEFGGFDNLVVEESSTFKNPSSQRFKLLRKHVKDFKRRFILTGTPTPNSLLDLWSQIFILDEGERLGRSFYQYRQRFFYPEDYMQYNWVPKPGAEEAILKLVSDIIYRVPAEGNLPPREVVRNPIRVNLPKSARKTYEELEDRAFSALSEQETITASTAAAAMMKLRQVASGFVYDDDGKTQEVHKEKVLALRSIAEETGSPIIVVYQFLHELAALKKAFPAAKEFSSDLIDDWNAGKVPMMFLHPQSGGHGLNLQYGGHTMVIFSGSFSYEQMSQTMARIDRQGQKAPVVFHYLVVEDTVDDLLLEVFLKKERNQKRVLERIKEYATEKAHRR